MKAQAPAVSSQNIAVTTIVRVPAENEVGWFAGYWPKSTIWERASRLGTIISGEIPFWI